MATLEEVLAFRDAMFDRSRGIVAKKGHDYNRSQQAGGDTLFNLRVCALLGVVDTPERGILVRLSDKFMRLGSLTAEAGVEAQVQDESVLDTVADIHNYVDYLALMHLESRKLNQAPRPADTEYHGDDSASVGDSARKAIQDHLHG